MPKLLKKKKSEINEIIKVSKSSTPKKKKLNYKNFIPTGSTQLNLACSGLPHGGFHIGKMTNVIGDSNTGKTLLALTHLALCSKLKRFKNYHLILDDVETALEFDLEYLFGKDFAKRLIVLDPPSETIEDFMLNINNYIVKKKPFLYVLDSFDSLSSRDEEEKEKANIKKREKGQKESGSYGDGKPKIFSKFCRMNMGKIKKAKSHLLIVSQTRDNIGFGAMFQPKVRSGGRALKFYATHEIWLAHMKKETALGLVIGSDVQAKVTKNKITGKRRNAKFTVYDDYGVDDVTSCVEYLIEVKYWKKKKKKYNVKDFKFLGNKKSIIKYIEKNNLEKELQEIVGKVWNIIEEKVRLTDRKRRF